MTRLVCSYPVASNQLRGEWYLFLWAVCLLSIRALFSLRSLALSLSQFLSLSLSLSLSLFYHLHFFSLFFSLFSLCKISASGRSVLISAIVSPSFLSELLALRYLCLACGGPLPSEYPTWPLDPGVAWRVRNSSGQQMHDCTLSRGVGSASGLNRFTESMKGLGVGWWWHENNWEWFAVSFCLLPYCSPIHHKTSCYCCCLLQNVSWLSNLIIFELIRTWSDILQFESQGRQV